jgi:hypothetical protein
MIASTDSRRMSAICRKILRFGDRFAVFHFANVGSGSQTESFACGEGRGSAKLIREERAHLRPLAPA